MFTFTQSYHPKTKKYDGHTTPSGAHVVPPDELGNRVMYGWEFHYKMHEDVVGACIEWSLGGFGHVIVDV